MKTPRRALLIGMVAALGVSTRAQVVYTGGTYGQNFDSLAASGTGISWANNSTLPGWFLYRQPAPGTAITSYAAGTGSSTTGSFYSFGASGSGERAVGAVGSGGTYWGSPGDGAVAGWMAVGLVNNTGQTLTQFTVSYAGEQWRVGASNNNPETMVFEYGWGGAFTGVGTWTAPGGNFDWTTPVTTTGSGAAVDGNTTGRVPDRGGTISGFAWNPGDTLWLRWQVRNAPGNDHGLAIDDFTFVAVPEPRSVALWTGLGLLMLVRARRQRRSA